MSRRQYVGCTRAGNGTVVQAATVAVYLTGTSTAASIYTASSGGTAVNSVTSDATDGTFEFFVDYADYGPSQLFDITVSKTGFRSQTFEGIAVLGDGIMVSSNDTTPGYLNGKLTAGLGVTLTEGTDAGDETLSVGITLGTARQVLSTNAAADDVEWIASLQSLMTAQGDTVYASSANTPARLAKGSAYQAYIMNSGATAPSWAASLQSLLTAQGDTIYASAANTPARLAKGSAGQVKRMNAGATAPEWASIFTSMTAQAATSGTSLTFTGIPATAKLIILMLSGVSTNGTSRMIVQMGDSGGPEATDYLGSYFGWTGAATGANSVTAGIALNAASVAASAYHGLVTLANIDGNTWVASAVISGTGTTIQWSATSTKTLSGVLDRVVITTEGGTDTFDAGTINIMYV